jgi:hypothetical protein
MSLHGAPLPSHVLLTGSYANDQQDRLQDDQNVEGVLTNTTDQLRV